MHVLFKTTEVNPSSSNDVKSTLQFYLKYVSFQKARDKSEQLILPELGIKHAPLMYH